MQTLEDETMPLAFLARQRNLLNQDGYHIIYNVSRNHYKRAALSAPRPTVSDHVLFLANGSNSLPQNHLVVEIVLIT